MGCHYVVDKNAVPQFVLRHCNFRALTSPGGAYTDLLNSTDLAMMPWLSKFQVSLLQQECLLTHLLSSWSNSLCQQNKSAFCLLRCSIVME